MHNATFIAVDLGASGGRVLAGTFDGERFNLEELHRFANGPVTVLGKLHWDVLNLWDEIKTGLRRYDEQEKGVPQGIGVDTWGVDFALLDASGSLLSNPHHYRDARTDGVMEQVFEEVSRDRLYARTGIQFMQINTLYQLYSMREDSRLSQARTLLMMPDLFHFWLTGRAVGEYTIASTSQLLDARRRTWDVGLLEDLSLPPDIFPDLVQPGTVIGSLLEDVANEVGLSGQVPVIATGSHDTASAVAAIPDLDDKSVFISSGTWSLMGVEVTEPLLSEQARALDVTNEGGVGGTIRLLKNVAGLWLLQESRRQWRSEGREYSWEELLELAFQAEPFHAFVNPGAETFLSPGNMPAAVRAYCRATGQPEPEGDGAVVRCCLESLALKYRSVLDGLEGLLGHRLERIFIVGGGSQNDLLNQFTADACAREVMAGPVEATALGNLMMQAVASGAIEDVATGRKAVAASTQRQYYAPQHTDAWETAYERFEGLLEQA